MKISIANTCLTANFDSKGAELVTLFDANQNYIWNGNPEFWNKHSPILFPIVGTLKNNQYLFEGKTYQLNRHGFARDLDFEVVSKTENSVVFSIESNSETHLLYPFEFELQIEYILIKKHLHVNYKVINNDKKTIPFSIGGHPAFALNKAFENYDLAFSDDNSVDYFLLDDNLISEKSNTLALPNRKLKLNYQLFEHDALVIKKMKSTAITVFENEKPYLKFNFQGFPNFGIWTKPNAPFICLEPWFGYSDKLNSSFNLIEKEGIIILNKNEIFQANYSIEILK